MPATALHFPHPLLLAQRFNSSWQKSSRASLRCISPRAIANDQNSRIAPSKSSRGWTSAQEAEMHKMRAEGIPVAKIATFLGKTQSDCYARWMRIQEREMRF